MDEVKKVLKEYLDNRAIVDRQFAANYAKEGKNLEECVRYILTEAKKRGSAVFMTDAEVFGLAVHYYDEDNLEVPKSVNGCKVTTPKSEKAKKEIEKKIKEHRKAKKDPQGKPEPKQLQLSLDF